MPPEFIGLAAVLLIFGTPFVAILTGHHRKLVEMKLKAGQHVDDGVLAKIRELQQQIVELRDTTTKYDMTIDSSLSRLDSRLSNIESRVTRLERPAAVVDEQPAQMRTL